MVRRGVVPSREAARRAIVAGQVLVDGSFADKPARMVDGAQSITLAGPPPQFVGRGGEKLAGALEAFGIDPDGLRCLDAGSSTGGFTDCLLQHGADWVLAVDVGTNQLHEKLRADPRVEVRERTDVRSLTMADVGGEPVDLVVGDLSFISLRLVLPAITPLVSDHGAMVLLVKPQFEAGKDEASRGRGVITDPAIWRRTLGEVVRAATDLGIGLAGVVPSPITGSAGNVEFVAWLRPGRPSMPGSEEALDAVVSAVEARSAASDAAGAGA